MIASNKIELRYCPARDALTAPRDRVPDELDALHVDYRTWVAVWDKTLSTVKAVKRLEAKKESIQRKIDGIEGSAAVIKLAASLVDEKHSVRYEQEMEWSELLDFACDAFHAWNVDAQLLRRRDALPLVHCGLVFRFRPVGCYCCRCGGR